MTYYICLGVLVFLVLCCEDNEIVCEMLLGVLGMALFTVGNWRPVKAIRKLWQSSQSS